MHIRLLPVSRLSRRTLATSASRTLSFVHPQLSRQCTSSTNSRIQSKLITPVIASPTSRLYSTTHLVRASTPMAASTDTAAAQEASNSGITPESLTSTLQQKLDASHVDIEDMSGGCGQAFNAVIVSKDFEGKTLLQRHRLVNNALKDEIKAIHAWTPRCLTEKQWEEEKARSG